VPVADPLYYETRDIADIPNHRLVEIKHFFATYTELEGKEVEVGDWEGADAAMEEIRECLKPEYREISDCVEGCRCIQMSV
jgi:inorganic pyrophosphatase